MRGIELSLRFYREVLRPLLDECLGDAPHSAALLGPGSEVLGYDTERSKDHDWGPRLLVFLTTGDAERHALRVDELLAERLPPTFLGHPTRFVVTADADGQTRHRVVVVGLAQWLTDRLGFDPRVGVTTVDWLATPTQRLAEMTAGAVFHDGLRELDRVRDLLAWYPPDVWRYALADGAAVLRPAVPGDRRAALRPCLRSTITDPTLRDLPPIGAIDQLVDSTDGLGDLRLLRRITAARFEA